MYLRKSSNRRQDASIDEPLNTDSDGNELLLVDVLTSDDGQVGEALERNAERTALRQAVGRLSARERKIMEMRFGAERRAGAHPERGGGFHRNLPELHLPAGKADHEAAAPGDGGGGLNPQVQPAELCCTKSVATPPSRFISA